eukprot:1146846-Pelagomonas_calceolata.AAC.2
MYLAHLESHQLLPVMPPSRAPKPLLKCPQRKQGSRSNDTGVSRRGKRARGAGMGSPGQPLLGTCTSEKVATTAAAAAAATALDTERVGAAGVGMEASASGRAGASGRASASGRAGGVAAGGPGPAGQLQPGQLLTATAAHPGPGMITAPTASPIAATAQPDAPPNAAAVAAPRHARSSIGAAGPAAGDPAAGEHSVCLRQQQDSAAAGRHSSTEQCMLAAAAAGKHGVRLPHATLRLEAAHAVSVAPSASTFSAVPDGSRAMVTEPHAAAGLGSKNFANGVGGGGQTPRAAIPVAGLGGTDTLHGTGVGSQTPRGVISLAGLGGNLTPNGMGGGGQTPRGAISLAGLGGNNTLHGTGVGGQTPGESLARGRAGVHEAAHLQRNAGSAQEAAHLPDNAGSFGKALAEARVRQRFLYARGLMADIAFSLPSFSLAAAGCPQQAVSVHPKG